MLEARDYLAFGAAVVRNTVRVRRWARAYRRALADGSFRLPSPTVLQLLPTEACNLRCSMCNQWGDSGYLKLGVRKVVHMDPDGFARVLAEIDPRQTAVSIHGGEPFAYKHVGRMIDALAARPYDVMVSTNGTLMDDYVDELVRIEHLGLLYSIDGDQAGHDAVRGPGTFARAQRALARLFAARRRAGARAPLVVVSYTVCEATRELHRMRDVARELGAVVLNLNMRWFLRTADGEAYERHLRDHLNVTSSGAWRGWLVDDKPHDYRDQAAAAARLVATRHLRPPFVITTPSGLRGGDFLRYFTEPGETFGNDTCFMPSYWARVHANGDLIYCPGHPDVIAGNVLRDGLMAAFNSEMSIKFRKHLRDQRMPICARCCGLYMNSQARTAEQRVRRSVGLSTSSVRSSLRSGGGGQI